MQYAELSSVKHRVVVGAPLPYNVRNADRTLLLAKGQVIESIEQMESLFERGALVDIAELLTQVDRIRTAPREKLPAMWTGTLHAVSDTLRQSAHEGFAMALESTTPAVVALVERDPDLAIFQVLRQDANEYTQYGIDHSLHAAITAFLVAQRLGWNDSDSQRVFKAASGRREVSDFAALVRRADIYTAKLSARGSRSAMTADQVGRTMFMQDAGHPMTAALVKEFGVYPPGCFVRLASGETGIVVKRGPTVTTPVVAVLSAADGAALAEPIRRDTSQKAHAVHAVLSGHSGLGRIAPEKLVAIAA
ncbi:MAG: hypothetical protein HY021_02765 [Burkholderiales bacterium]|nr:hypothetical protein [Burkholderiales bacterium]